MGNPVNRDLFAALVAAIPLKFMDRLHQGIPQIYLEAFHATHNDPLLQEPEANYMTPHYRRALVETWLRTVGTECGMQANAEWNSKSTAQFTVLTFGNFFMTGSYVNERGCRVRNALFRQDLATLNQLVSQLSLPILEASDAEKLRVRQDSIYCILLHGPDPLDKTKVGFMEFAFPEATTPHWIERFAFEDVYQAIRSRNAVAQSDGAIPKLKKKPDQKGGAG